MSDLRDLPPVEHNVELPERLSQTFLARTDVCARSAFLYLSEPQTTSHAMDRGTLFHEFAKRFVELLIENEENAAPPEVTKDLLAVVIEENPTLQVPESEMDACRIMAYHFAENLWLDPSKVVALEKKLLLDIDGVTVSGKVDLACVWPEARHAEITDWKTNFAPDSMSEDAFEGTFQTKMYALMLAEGIGEDDPVSIGRGIDTFTVREVFPRNRTMPERKVTLDRMQLADFKQTTLQAAIRRAEHGFETGKWQAVTGSHCSTCAAPHACPLPAILIPTALPDDDLPALSDRELFLAKERSVIVKKLRADVDANGPRAVGSDQEWRFDFSISQKLDPKKKDELIGFIEQAGGDPADYFSETSSVTFAKRKVKAA